MGVPNFYSSIQRKWPQMKSSVSGDMCCDHLCVDMGSVLHACISVSGTEDELISATKRYVCNLITMANPKKTVYIAFDGVPPITKAFEQALRRSRNVKGDKPLNRSILSPGTKFMDRISKEMQSMDSPIERLKITVSPSSFAGEGEQKLIQYIKQLKSSSVINFGADSDLVILSLQLDSKIKILKESFWSSNVFEVVDIELLKQGLEHEYSFSTKRKLIDVILVFCLLGNDYIPRPFNIEVSPDKINFLLSSLQCLHSKGLHLVNSDTSDINDNSLKEFCGILNDSGFQSYKVLFPLSKSRSAQEALTLSLNNLSLGERKTEIKSHLEGLMRRNYDNWKFEQTRNFLPTIDEQRNCSEDFIMGLQWVLKYYLNNENAKLWIPRYNHRGPMVQNLCKSLDISISDRFARLPETIGLSPLEHLCLILPSSSSSMVPLKYQGLVQAEKVRDTHEGLLRFHGEFHTIK